jgi:hypothetical protein
VDWVKKGLNIYGVTILYITWGGELKLITNGYYIIKVTALIELNKWLTFYILQNNFFNKEFS